MDVCTTSCFQAFSLVVQELNDFTEPLGRKDSRQQQTEAEVLVHDLLDPLFTICTLITLSFLPCEQQK